MPVTVGGSNGVTYPDATTTTAANVTTVFSPYITDTTNIMTINSGVMVVGSVGVQTQYGITTTAAKALAVTYSSNTTNATIDLPSLTGYSPGTSNLTVTVNAGIYVYSTSTSNAGLTITGGKSGDTITIVNNGYIMGMGGQGSGNTVGSLNASAAISLPSAFSSNITINNTNASAYIGGGGGGGGGALGVVTYGVPANFHSGGGGAGGGAGGSAIIASVAAAGGAGGAVGASGSNGAVGGTTAFGSGGGGRVFPSTSTTLTSSANAVGLGGSGGGTGSIYTTTSATSIGGGPGVAGSASGGATTAGGGGGGWGASGGAPTISGTLTASGVGTGGKAVALNGNSVTWVSGNTTRVYGAVS